MAGEEAQASEGGHTSHRAWCAVSGSNGDEEEEEDDDDGHEDTSS